MERAFQVGASLGERMSPLMGLIPDVAGEIWMIIYTGNYPEWSGPPDRVDRSPRQACLILGSAR